MIEFLAPGFVYSLIKDGVNFVRGRRRHLKPAEIVALRQKWKPLFEAEIWKNHQNNLRRDVIIRDMKRIASYPETSERKGISAWFRVGLVDTYHRGIFVGLGWERLKQYGDCDQWTFAGGTAEESDGVTLLLVGRIPYENIESVDWDGDGYYGFPHIYCFFSFKGEPYEHVGFAPKPNHLTCHHFTRRSSLMKRCVASVKSWMCHATRECFAASRPLANFVPSAQELRGFALPGQ